MIDRDLTRPHNAASGSTRMLSRASAVADGRPDDVMRGLVEVLARPGFVDRDQGAALVDRMAQVLAGAVRAAR